MIMIFIPINGIFHLMRIGFKVHNVPLDFGKIWTSQKISEKRSRHVKDIIKWIMSIFKFYSKLRASLGSRDYVKIFLTTLFFQGETSYIIFICVYGVNLLNF